MSASEWVSRDCELPGLAPDDGVMSLFRVALDARGVLSGGALAGLGDRTVVRLAGRVVVRQRPSSARGFAFITLEDETGLVASPGIRALPGRAANRRLAAGSGAVAARGRGLQCPGAHGGEAAVAYGLRYQLWSRVRRFSA